jgi:ornithine cyclodeaminase
MVDELVAQGKSATVCRSADLAQQISSADIISCATMSTTPIVLGQYLTEGTHLDLVGGFTPKMRETDDVAVQKSSVFVDTRAGALSEAGDLTQAMDAGNFGASQVLAELSDFSHKKHVGRSELSNPDSQITLFKSVGAGREDLAAAILAYKKMTHEE